MHLRPKFLYGNDRKSHADLLVYKSEKMSLFDQKNLEVANMVHMNITEILIFPNFEFFDG